MEIYPAVQAQMFLAAFSTGLGAGLFRQVLLAIRTVLGAYLPSERMRALYERTLPLLHRPVGFPVQRARRVWCFFVAFCGDLLYCLICAFALLLLLYDYNSGAWRVSVPVLFLLGLASFRVLTSRVLARMNDYFAFWLSAFLCYARAGVCWPVRVTVSLVQRFVLAPVKRGITALCKKKRARRSARLCRAQLALAAHGLIVKERKMSDVKKEDHTSAMDHQDPDRAAVLHRACRGLWPFAGMERSHPPKRGAGKKEG